MIAIFMGGIRPLPPDNKPTGIFKRLIEAPVWVDTEGLAGDAQADRRVHGGPEKAVHQYPVAHYAALAAAFPEARDALVPGSMGENISAPGWDEASVAIGDVFRCGDVVLQVSQPRSPCWKIDQRFGVDGMAAHIAARHITGWYFRVLEAGAVEPGVDFMRIDRNAEPLPIAALLTLWAEHRPDPQRLLEVTRIPGLSSRWVEKLEDRAARLRQLA
ncbi:MAG: MOSC domain-containing protein [Rhodocyclaceae bacterium]|jgi:MOSC domain-containing protein YiiM|nr:MOSC domain-containing protein [Rhodocyclaceae bacterium]